MSRAEDDARHLEAHALKRSGLPPAYRPVRARLLLQVEGREAVPVLDFEPVKSLERNEWFQPRTDLWPMMIAASLTVEVRELLAEQRAHEEGDPAHCYVGNKSHDAHELLAPGQKCGHCSFIAPEGTDHA